MTEHPFPYEGPEELRQPILTALRRVVDPEVALNVVDVGLIYGVTVADGKLHAQTNAEQRLVLLRDCIVQRRHQTTRLQVLHADPERADTRQNDS